MSISATSVVPSSILSVEEDVPGQHSDAAGSGEPRGTPRTDGHNRYGSVRLSHLMRAASVNEALWAGASGRPSEQRARLRSPARLCQPDC